LGLAGSLVVGLLELFAGHGQNRFYSELEEWLSSITKISLSNVDGDGLGSEQMATVLEQMLVQMDMLRETVRRSEDRRADADERMMQLTSAVGALAERMGTGGHAHAPAPNTGASDALVQKMVDSQEKMSSALISREEESTQAGAEMRMRLRNIDVQMLRILEEMAAGRQDSVAELRQDIQTLTETLRSAIREG
ncbi:MAG: biopolymer transporter ExbB, partial [Pseudomonadota bacterium]